MRGISDRSYGIHVGSLRVLNWFDPNTKVTHSLAVGGSYLNDLDIVMRAENLLKLSGAE